MVRAASVWTWDVGERKIDFDARPEALVLVLETIPHLHIPSNTRRLIELWIDEGPARLQAKR